jgi:type II secretory pathway pseudopilin PulG
MVIALLVAGIMISGVVAGFVQYSRQAEWSAHSLAAQMQAVRRLEQVRAGKWQPLGSIPVDQLVSSNFPILVDVLDVSTTGGNAVYATNTTTITMVSTNPPIKMIRIDCTWPFMNRGVMTNSIFTYRAPDQ